MEEIGKRGYYVDSVQLTNLYNKVLEKRVTPTNCSACLKSRLRELVEALNRFERLSQRLSEAQTEEQVDNLENAVNLHSNSLGCLPQEENKPVRTKKKK